MVGLKRLVALGALLGMVSCGQGKAPTPAPPVGPLPPSATEKLFPKPYFPTHDPQIDGRDVGELAGWSAACVYTETKLTDAQKAWVATLEPAGGEGKVAVGFTEDFDGDGKKETVEYGAYAKGTTEGNFVLVTRGGAGKPEILLLKELPGPPQFTVFTLKPDGSLWFGGGIDAGEVTMKVSWENHLPMFSWLTE